MRILLISHPFPWITGGFKRSYEVTRRLAAPGCEVTLLLSPQMAHELADEVRRSGMDPRAVYSCLDEMRASGVAIHPAGLNMLADLLKNDPVPKGSAWRSFISIAGPLIPADVGMSRLLSRYLKHYCGDLTGYDLVYAHHECLDTSMLARYIAEQFKIPFVILLHNEPFRPTGRILKIHPVRSPGHLVKLVPVLNLNLSTRFEYWMIRMSGFFRGFLAISPAPLLISGMTAARHAILFPANAVNNERLSLAGPETEKENIIIYASRFAEDKGIFELLDIWKLIHEKKQGFRLLVYGHASAEAMAKFKGKIHDLCLMDSVQVCGYEHDEKEFHDRVARARMLLHPSHSDGFAMIIPECLALGTPVVTYDLPAFTYYYREFGAVCLVPEWDREAFCQAALDIIDHPEKYAAALTGSALQEFIRRHNSWDAVAGGERKTLLSFASEPGS